MRIRRYFLASIVGAFIALCLHITARDLDIESVTIRAKTWNRSDTEKIQMRAEADRLAHRGHVVFWIGLFFTFGGLACLVTAIIRHEPGWYLIPVFLLLSDVMTQILL